MCCLCHSCLHGDPNGRGLHRALLEVITAGMVSTRAQAGQFTQYSLLAVQRPASELDELITKALDYLSAKQFISRDPTGQIVKSTKLGKVELICQTVFNSSVAFITRRFHV